MQFCYVWEHDKCTQWQSRHIHETHSEISACMSSTRHYVQHTCTMSFTNGSTQHWEHDTYDDTDSRKIIHVHSPLMPWVYIITRIYNVFSRQIQPTRNGSTHAVSMHKMIVSTQWYTLEADTAHLEMGPLMPGVTTRTLNAHSRQIQPTHRWVHSCREWKLEHTMHTRGRYSPLIDGPTHVESMTTGTNSKFWNAWYDLTQDNKEVCLILTED